MPTFAEWEARRRGGQGAPTAVAPDDEDLTPSALGPMYKAGLGDTPETAFVHEVGRTAKEAGVGLLRSPWDLAKNTVNTVLHPLDTLMGLGHAVAHPVDTAIDLAKNPREAGSTLGQLLLAPKVPGAANTALAEGPGVMGRGVSAVGRGMEAVGTSKVLKSANKYGAIGTAVSGHPGLAALELAAPPALEYGGKLAQKGGAALEGLDLSLKRNPFRGAPAAAAEEAISPEADTVRETVKTARDLKDNKGMSAKQAGQRAGWPLSASEEVPYQAEAATPNPDLFPYQKDSLQGLREARSVQRLADKFRDNAWANDTSASPEILDPEAQSLRDQTGGAYEPSELDSRITGLSPLDELARASGRMKPDFRADELLKKLGGKAQP